MNSLLYSLVGIKLLTGTCREHKEQCVLIKCIGYLPCLFSILISNLQEWRTINRRFSDRCIFMVYLQHFKHKQAPCIRFTYLKSKCVCLRIFLPRVFTMWKELLCKIYFYLQQCQKYWLEIVKNMCDGPFTCQQVLVQHRFYYSDCLLIQRIFILY